MAIWFKPGDLVCVTLNTFQGYAYATIKGDAVEMYGEPCYRLRFLRPVRQPGGNLLFVQYEDYDCNVRFITPATQKEVDNWILEQELTS